MKESLSNLLYHIQDRLMDQGLSFDRHFTWQIYWALLLGGFSAATRFYFTKDCFCQAVIGKNLAHFATFGCITFPFTFTLLLFGIRHPLFKQSNEGESDRYHLLLSPDFLQASSLYQKSYII